MATARISQATWDSIGKEILKDSGGIKNLVNDVIHMSYDYPNKSLSELAEVYCYQGNCLTAYNVEKAHYLDKHNIPYRDGAKKFDKVYGQAINYLVVNYMKKHNVRLVRTKNQYGIPHYVLVKN